MKHVKFFEVAKTLKNAGYVFDRQKGSHAIYKREGKSLSIPAKREVSPGVYRQVVAAL